jgi:hypothetical protein
MKKIILTLTALSFLVSCAPENKLSQPTPVSGEVPKDAPPPPPGGETPPPSPTPSPAVDKTFEKLQSDVAFYKGRYQMPDIYKKITDNHGNGFEDLYGTRNMREVLAGVYYRGGANNAYHRTHPRGNMNPLPADGLDNLCKEGFALSLYYYSTNYSTAKKVNPCALRTSGQANTLNYNQMTASSIKDFKPFLQLIYDRIKGKLSGPIYGHCWNGWHASGMMAAITLKQFCGFTAAEADAYWVKNTDGNSSGHDSVRNQIKNFKPVTGLEITEQEKALICPKK